MLPTWEALQVLGFLADPKVQWSDMAPGHSFDFGTFRLEVRFFYNLTFRKVASFSGLISGPRSITQISFEMPFEVESVEQCAAWIARNLDNQGAAQLRAPWLEMGREHQDTLPWVRRSAAYKARPHCYVQRDWARIAFKDLRNIAETADDQMIASFGFDGAVLTVQCGKHLIPIPAEGLAWPSRFTVPAAHLKNLPTRLMSERIGFSVFEGKLSIANRVFDALQERTSVVKPVD
jgi:hypothetical protein